MIFYGTTPDFWVEFAVIMAIVLCLLGVVPVILRRVLGADKVEWVAVNHINTLHKKGDWTLRMLFMVTLIICTFLFIQKSSVLIFISMIFMVTQHGFEAFVQWKFAENRNNYKVVMMEIVLFLMVFVWILGYLEGNS